eukprot:scaffold69213_cov34-Attheya_sp.AAC.5
MPKVFLRSHSSCFTYAFPFCYGSDQFIAPNLGENPINEKTMTEPIATASRSGEKVPQAKHLGPNSGETGPNSGETGETVTPPFPFPDDHLPAAAAYVHQSYPDVPEDFWDDRYNHDIDMTSPMGPTYKVGIALRSSEIETLNHQHHLDYIRSIVDPDLDVDSEFFQVLAVTNHMIRH